MVGCLIGGLLVWLGLIAVGLGLLRGSRKADESHHNRPDPSDE